MIPDSSNRQERRPELRPTHKQLASCTASTNLVLRGWARWVGPALRRQSTTRWRWCHAQKHAVEVRKPASHRKIIVLPCRDFAGPSGPAPTARRLMKRTLIMLATGVAFSLSTAQSSDAQQLTWTDKAFVTVNFGGQAPSRNVEHDDISRHLWRASQLRDVAGRRRRRLFRHCRRLQDLAQPRCGHRRHARRQQSRPGRERQHSGPTRLRPATPRHDLGR